MNNNTLNNMTKSLLKRQEAFERFKARKEAFLIAKKQFIAEIEEGRIIWKNILEQLPKQEFDS